MNPEHLRVLLAIVVCFLLPLWMIGASAGGLADELDLYHLNREKWEELRRKR